MGTGSGRPLQHLEVFSLVWCLSPFFHNLLAIRGRYWANR
jgi:hypothetical protein